MHFFAKESVIDALCGWYKLLIELGRCLFCYHII